MRIIRHYYECPPQAKHTVLALGNFDGMHLGHQAVIQQTLDIAHTSQLQPAVMTFEPHPTALLRPGQPFRLMAFHEKAQHLDAMGISILFAQAFNLAFSQLTAEEFVRQVLVEALDVRHVVIGRDFVFGHKRSGNALFLHEKASQYGFGFTQLGAVADHSSSDIRHALQKGDLATVSQSLGRPYSITGRVSKGDQRGRQLGFPTANIALKDRIRPAFGVYKAIATVDGQDYAAAVNIGKKPTFSGVKECLEAHILHFNRDIYGKYIKITLLEYLRPEQKFESLEALKHQINRDIAQCE